MWGNVASINSGPFEAYANASSVAGVGMLPEGIDQNSPFYSLLFDVAWETVPVDLAKWWSDWALQRYGVEDERANRAWAILAETVYGEKQEAKSMYGEKARDGITSYMWSGDEEAIQPAWLTTHTSRKHGHYSQPSRTTPQSSEWMTAAEYLYRTRYGMT